VSDIVGKDGKIYWWIGEVANRVDPLQLGRCQVKIFGWHNDGNETSKNKITVSDLPWATPVVPCNTGTAVMMGTPQQGDWVLGFFLDGPAGQFPIMWGVLPAFNPTAADKASFNNINV
jgi:hypothetical protein